MDISNKSYKKYFKLLKNKTLNNKEKYSDEYINSVKLLVRNHENNQLGGNIFSKISSGMIKNAVSPNRKKKIKIFTNCKDEYDPNNIKINNCIREKVKNKVKYKNNKNTKNTTKNTTKSKNGGGKIKLNKISNMYFKDAKDAIKSFQIGGDINKFDIFVAARSLQDAIENTNNNQSKSFLKNVLKNVNNIIENNML